MKKSCWEILGIPKSNDTGVIKKAYRDLLKQYHPDKCQAPEKIRKNTIKCVEIIQAYKEALELASSIQFEPQPNPRSSSKVQPPPKQPSVFARAFGSALVLLITIPVLFLFLEMAGIYHGFSKGMNFIFNVYFSLPPDNLFKMIISLPLALILGAICNGLLSVFTSAPVLYLWSVLSNTKYEKHMYKVGFVLVAILNICVVYLPTGLHWPFEQRQTPYFAFLYELTRFLACSYGPLYMLSDWLVDNWKYLQVKDSFKLHMLVVIDD
jgi:hypothetical protein